MVSRETSDPLLERYAQILSTTGVERGLIGPREAGRIWERHLLNCAASAQLAPPGSLVIDVGSGAGLPGLVWAIARPDLEVILLEPLLRRYTFLSEVIEDLEMAPRVRAVRCRAEDYRAAPADVATARAVAPLEKLVGWTLPLVRPGGLLIALKGSSASQELEAARAAILASGGVNGRIVDLSGEHGSTAAVLVDKQASNILRTPA